MTNVVHVAFGMEREWNLTREKTISGLIAIGSLYGDEAKLMQAKGERVYKLLREMVENIPTVRVTARYPERMTASEREMVEAAVKAAALKGIEAALTHAVECFMGGVYEICTSKLKEGA